jgi:hypothetical protein
MTHPLIHLQKIAPGPVSGPYTHRAHMDRCVAAWARGEVLRDQWVQVKVAGEVHCGKLLDAWTTPDGVDLWIVDIDGFGRRHVPVAKVVQCSGLDGLCACEARARGPACGDARGPRRA